MTVESQSNNSVIPPLLNHIFDITHNLMQERAHDLSLFAKYNTRMEGWLQCEMMILMQALRKPVKVEKWGKVLDGVKIEGKKVQPDFQLKLDGNPHYLEVKVLMGQRGMREQGVLGKDLPNLRYWGGAGSLMILSLGSKVSWQTAAKKLQGAGLTRLREEPIKGEGLVALSLWQCV